MGREVKIYLWDFTASGEKVVKARKFFPRRQKFPSDAGSIKVFSNQTFFKQTKF
jgi:hypothetical protein